MFFCDPTELSTEKLVEALQARQVSCIVPFVNWPHEQCLEWLRTLPAALGLHLESLEAEPFDGQTLVEALDSTRELKDTFGLQTMHQRLAFEQLVKEKVQETDISLQQGTTGAVFSASFLRAAKPLYDLHMGTENMGPLLYSLIRFVKPRKVLEIGAGYTSVYMAQALADNHAEICKFKRLTAAGQCQCGDVPWGVDGEVRKPHVGVLTCVDNMSHEYATACDLPTVANHLGIGRHLKLEVADAWQYLEDLPELEYFDFMWIDVGAGERMRDLFEVCVEHLSGEGGFVAVHSTLTNAQMRAWLDPLRGLDPSSTLHGQSNPVPDRNLEPSLVSGPDASPDTDPRPCSRLKQETNSRLDGTSAPGCAYELVALSLLEPLKLFQNSCTLFQKRAREYSEPVYSEYP
uniref:Uncharacterized protein n=1 Tax=Eutreptiella gymnastica TaxID=73025 RepID=A0A7S1NHH9_9EUGL|mmetsp:Transcript_36515/g.65315  ORF Transcript_36515/g.65315 Transcript_36515/m.65315 type:complete len:404 (+) Transcript_36515:50-1261(+)